MDLMLEGKVAIITGGGSGLGRETAKYLAREGVRLVLADRNECGIQTVVQEVADCDSEAKGFPLDVRDYQSCEDLAAFAKQCYGRVDILVASAGVSENRFFLETTPDDWAPLLDINVRGLLNTNRAIAPIMVTQESGAIINIASEAAKQGEKRLAVYSGTKGAVMSFTKAFALEMARFKVRVNAVCPAVTMTPMTSGLYATKSPEDYRQDPIYQAASKFYPLGRLGEAHDIASMITFLASDQCSWVTGQAISVNGGFGRA
jgi:NAD(P)-dependent dehydrogenase (short-subunit alcohol dehydrogenase family)